jgi:Insect cuticle protein
MEFQTRPRVFDTTRRFTGQSLQPEVGSRSSEDLIDSTSEFDGVSKSGLVLNVHLGIFRFLTSSPDQRRAEATGPDGITRGSYSYLDDKGVQRTVKYIAGAGIGYKVIESTVGPGTHVSANSDVPEHSIKAVSNEIAVADNDGVPYHTGPSAPSGPSYISSTVPPTYVPQYSQAQYPPSAFSTATSYPTQSYPTQSYPPSSPFASSPRPFSRPGQEPVFVTTPSSIGGIDRNFVTPTSASLPSGGPSPLAPSGPSGSSGELDTIYGLLPPKEDNFYTKQYIPPSHPTPSGPVHIHITPPPQPPSIYYAPPSPTPTYLPTAESHQPHPYAPSGPEHYPEQNYHHQHQAPVDAVIKNTSNGWFYGVPPGSSLRAHIQNIDLVPTHDRALSPSEALRRDEERDARQHRNHHHRRQV